MSSLLNIGTRAMSAAYAQLTTTGNNIANSSVTGYSRQQVLLSTTPGQFTGSGFFGKGVDVSSVTRSHDDYLTSQASITASQSAADSTRLTHLGQLESLFPMGATGIGAAAGALLSSFGDIASSPTDSSARQVALSDAKDVATRFQNAGGQLDTIQTGVTASLKTQIDSVNGVAKNIASLNQQISALRGLGQPPNDLLDQRDEAIQKLSSLVQVTTVAADDGSTGVFIAGGQQLVLGNTATPMVAVQDTYDPAQMHIGVVDGSNTRILQDDSLAGGSIAGLMKFQSQDLKDARNLLGQLAASFSSAVNQQQALGLDQSRPAVAGAPIFAVSAPITRPAATNAKDAAGNYVSSASLTVVDASALQASDYQLQADPATPGNYLVTRMSDGKQTSVADGATIDGFQINVGSPAPAATDRFLMQPVGNAASSISVVLSDPKGIATASPVTGSVGVNNTGTASIGSLAAVSTTLDPTAKVAISFTDNAGSYSWQQLDAGNNLIASGTATWTAGSPIALNGFSLQLNGVPKSGDTVNVNPTTNPSSNNGNALAFVALSSKLTTNGQSITDAYASAMSNIGVRVSSQTTAASISSAAASQAVTNNANQTGVNLDEEAARLIQYQQQYQAAGKMLQVAQTLFTTLLQMTSS